jgi:hypothetical protein
MFLVFTKHARLTAGITRRYEPDSEGIIAESFPGKIPAEAQLSRTVRPRRILYGFT